MPLSTIFQLYRGGKGQRDKQRSTKRCTENHRSTRTPLKTGKIKGLN